LCRYIQGQDAVQTMGINLTQDDAPSTSHYNFSAEVGLYKSNAVDP
jgi:hypothetical protein